MSITTPVMTSVSMVMPEIGLVPMVAMARAATGAKKKEMMNTMAVPTRAGTRAFWMPRPKERKSRVDMAAVIKPHTHDSVARLQPGKVNRNIGRRTGMRLNIGMIGLK